MASRRLLLRAAKLLSKRAWVLRESCEGADGRLWACEYCKTNEQGKCTAQTEYEEMRACEKELREAA